MKLKTPQVAEFILETDIGQIPLLDEINFKIQFAKRADDYIDIDLQFAFDSNNANYRHQLEEDIYKGRFCFKDDKDFNNFTARNIIDFYIKTLRRIISIAYLNGMVGNCFDKHLHPELTLIDETLSMLEEKYEGDEAKLKECDERFVDLFSVLMLYETRLNQFTDQLLDLDINHFDRDITPHLHCAKERLYPCKVDLFACAAQTTLIIDIE